MSDQIKDNSPKHVGEDYTTTQMQGVNADYNKPFESVEQAINAMDAGLSRRSDVRSGEVGERNRNFEANKMILEYVLEGKLTVEEGARFLTAREAQVNHFAREVKDFADIDPKTGAFRDEIFWGKLRDIINKKKTFAVLMYDIDYFKQFNDTFGHPAGDRVLAEFCGTVFSQIRPEDIMGRIGGEEFMLIFPGISEPSELKTVAERIRTAVEETPVLATSLAGKDEVLNITCSMGGFIDRDGAIPWDRVKTDTDRLLYLAKGNGRNNSQILGVD